MALVSGGGGGTAGIELSYTQITASVNVVSTTESSGTTILSPSAFTTDGSPVLCEFFGHVLTPNTASGEVFVSLFESSTQITELCVVEAFVGAGSQIVVPVIGRYRFTPTAAAHTYTVTAFVTSTTGTPKIIAGAGGTGAQPPAFVRFTKV